MKKLSIFGKSVPILAILMSAILVTSASAVLLTYYGQIISTVDVEQSLKLDDLSWPASGLTESVSGVASDTIYGDPHYLTNMAAKTVYTSLTSSETGFPIGPPSGEGGLDEAYPEYKLDATVDDDAFSLILDSPITWSTFTGITFDYLIETGPNMWIPQINIKLLDGEGELAYRASWHSFRTGEVGTLGTPATITYDKGDFFLFDANWGLIGFYKDQVAPIKDLVDACTFQVFSHQAGETSIDPNPVDKLQVVSVSKHDVGGGTLAGIGVLPITSGGGPACAVLDFRMVYVFHAAAVPGEYIITTNIVPI